VIFFFNGASTTEIYSLSLHDALPISNVPSLPSPRTCCECSSPAFLMSILLDRKSTRLNSSHVEMSYAVFCLKKKTQTHDAGDLPRGKSDPETLRDPRRGAVSPGPPAPAPLACPTACSLRFFFFFFLKTRAPPNSPSFPPPAPFLS